MALKRVDCGYNNLFNALQALDGKGAEFGILSETGVMIRNTSGKKPINIAQVAHINEFGRQYRHKGGAFKVRSKFGAEKWVYIKPNKLITIPERPFIRPALYDNEAMLLRKMKAHFNKLRQNAISIEDIQKDLGEFMAEQIKFNILYIQRHPPLSKLQVWRKGSEKDLISLHTRIKYKVIG